MARFLAVKVVTPIGVDIKRRFCQPTGDVAAAVLVRTSSTGSHSSSTEDVDGRLTGWTGWFGPCPREGLWSGRDVRWDLQLHLEPHG